MKYDRFRFVWDVGGGFFPPAERTNCSSVLRNDLFWSVLKFLCKMSGPFQNKPNMNYMKVLKTVAHLAGKWQIARNWARGLKMYVFKNPSSNVCENNLIVNEARCI